MASKLNPALYVVATPIGNLGDISARARTTLADADLIVCEDTRVTGKLLKHLGIKQTLWAYHDHNAAAVRPKIVARLRDGGAVVLASDAGTPLISDPGYKLVRAAREANVPVISVPGPSALTAALSVAGLPTDRVLFGGFLPAKKGPRLKSLEELRDLRATLVFFTAGTRISATLQDLAAVLGDREAVVCRELTKLHEEVRRSSLADLSRDPSIETRGEFVIVVAPPKGREPIDDETLDRLILEALESETPSRAAAKVAEDVGLSKRRVYARTVALSKAR